MYFPHPSYDATAPWITIYRRDSTEITGANLVLPAPPRHLPRAKRKPGARPMPAPAELAAAPSRPREQPRAQPRSQPAALAWPTAIRAFR